MKNIDIKEIENIKDRLEELNKDDVLFIDEDDKARYAIIPVELYDQYEGIRDMLNENGPRIRVAAYSPVQLTYDEYESVKTQIMEALEKNFKPKPEKLN